jgi:peptide chain release factor subunit 1 (aeRF-1)
LPVVLLCLLLGTSLPRRTTPVSSLSVPHQQRGSSSLFKVTAGNCVLLFNLKDVTSVVSDEKVYREMSKYELKKLLDELEGVRGRNTELVSLYIPAGYNMAKIKEFVTKEQSEAENIKSKSTRKNVKSALDRLGRKVSESMETPENGVVLFCGNVSEREGRPDIQLWEVIPPEPVESRHYRCDKEFMLEPLREMVVDDRVYGLIVADKNEAAVGYLQGSTVKTAYTLDSEVPGKTRAGGQSAQRFARIRENMYDQFMKEIADKAKNAFLQKARDGDLLGIVVGGPGFTKDKLVDNDYLQSELDEKVLGKRSLNYSGEEALEELVSKSEEMIQDSRMIREKNLVSEFLENLREESGKAEYGPGQVWEALGMGAVDTVLVSESMELFHAVYEDESGEEEACVRAEGRDRRVRRGSDPSRRLG